MTSKTKRYLLPPPLVQHFLRPVFFKNLILINIPKTFLVENQQLRKLISDFMVQQRELRSNHSTAKLKR